MLCLPSDGSFVCSQFHPTPSKINYYTISPNSHHLATVLLEQPRSGTALIGIANVGVICNAMLHTFYLSKPKSLAKRRVGAATFRLPLMMCAGFGSVGNILFARALKSGNFTHALVGRLLIGFASAEVLNRKMVLSPRRPTPLRHSFR